MMREYFDSRVAVQDIFESTALGRLPMPYTFADIKGVYRPEQNDADVAEVKRLISDIEKKTLEDDIALQA